MWVPQEPLNFNYVSIMSPKYIRWWIRTLWNDARQVDRWACIYKHFRYSHYCCYRLYEGGKWHFIEEIFRKASDARAEVILIKWNLTNDQKYHGNSDWRTCAHLTLIDARVTLLRIQNLFFGLKWEWKAFIKKMFRNYDAKRFSNSIKI